jgi:hypothetical protein
MSTGEIRHVLQTKEQYDFVVAEIRELEELLTVLPEENVIERISLEARLQTTGDLLSKLNELEGIHAE